MVLQIAIGVAISVLSALFLNFMKDWKADKVQRQKEIELYIKRIENVELGVMEVLGNYIDDCYHYYMEAGFIPSEKLAQLKHVYEVYQGVHGNGVRTLEMHKLEELPNHPAHIGEMKKCCEKDYELHNQSLV